MAAIIVIMIIPFIFVLNGSIVSEREFILSGGVILIPRSFSLNVYDFLFREGSILPSFFLSLARIAVGVPLSLLLTTILAYALTKKKMPGYGALMVFLVFNMYFNGGLVPFLLMVRDIKVYNTFWMYVLPSAVSIFNALLLRNFFNTIPETLSESARIDGASEFVILFRIILPLSVPGIVTIGMFSAVAHWNDWFTGIAYMAQDRVLPLQTYLRKMIAITGLQLDAMGATADMIPPLPDTIKMGAIIITTLPIICVYPFAQKYFIKGLLIGAVKD